MQKNDVELIHRILDGDDAAFTELVTKYQRSVHALVWRKIGDFHIAEEITQDTFLKAYQKLSTLKRPQRFASWLYVIASRRCLAWQRKKRILTESLEETSSAQIEKATYSQYVVDENERISAETQRNVVKKLLAKLPESERTIITLHYFSEMSSSEIGAFLGVSANTIRSRLRRAQKRLQKEETMIREALDHFKLSPNLTENIMQEVSNLKPTPSTSKPIVPWAIATASAVLIMLMLGIGSQYLVRFQQPYSLDAQAEMTVELVDTPIVLNIDTEPDVRNQRGNSNVLGTNENEGQKPDEVLIAAAETEDENKVSVPKQQWIQKNGPEMGMLMSTLFHTTKGEVYFIDPGNRIYKLPVNRTQLQEIKDVSDLVTGWDDEIPLAELNDKLYTILSNELFSSTDGGKTWLSVGKCPEGKVTNLVIVDAAFYLVHEEQVFRSTDIGKTWIAIDKGLTGRINSLDANQNTLFAATDTGLYRLNADNWQHLQFSVEGADVFNSFAATENTLYVQAEMHWGKDDFQKQTWWLFRSNDNGDSWTDITPANAWNTVENRPFLTVSAAGKTVLLIGNHDGYVAKSNNNGNTWMVKENTGIPASSYSVFKAAAANESTYFTIGNAGILHSDDGGISWKRIRTSERSRIDNLICIKTENQGRASETFYAMIINDVFKSSDKGKSWQVVNPKQNITEYSSHQESPPEFTRIGETDGILYAKHGGESLNSEKTGLYRLAADGNTFVPIQGMPILDSGKIKELWSQRGQGALDLSDETLFKQLQEKGTGSTQFFKQLARGAPNEQNQQVKNQLYMEQNELLMMGLRGGFAISGDVYFIEYNFKLFRWEPGDNEWYDTGVEETTPELAYRKAAQAFEQEGLSQEKIWDIITSWSRGFKLAVSGDTIYVGKRDGHLVVSFDKGSNWINLTPVLPFPVKAYNDIVIVGDTVYVATDAGVAASDRGNNWGVIADTDGTNLNMDIFAADGTSLYGVTKGTGIYHLENGTWNQIVSEIPDNITSLTVDGNTLYVGTLDRGMLHINLEK